MNEKIICEEKERWIAKQIDNRGYGESNCDLDCKKCDKKEEIKNE